MSYYTFVAFVAFEIAFVVLMQQLGDYSYFEIWLSKVWNVDLELNDC